METRNVSVTLDKAKEWYNSGNAALKEVALQAFTEEELKGTDYKCITTIEEAKKALKIQDIELVVNVKGITEPTHFEHLVAINKIDIICKALNGDWKPSLTSGTVYYPWVKFYKKNDVPDVRQKDVTDYFIYNGEKYALVGGDYVSCGYGLGYYYGGDGACKACPGLFGCKSKEIALHISEYFAKEIFLACYAERLNGDIKWL